MITIYGIGGFCTIFFGYMIQTSLLQYWYYYRRKDKVQDWKIQPNAKNASIGFFWGLPLLSSKPNRAPYHRILTFFNLLMASTSAMITTECSVRQINQMTFETFSDLGWKTLCWQILFACTYECVVEFYWHLLMHTPFCYRVFHKLHHSYKSPEPWDDMYIHPLEAFGYYCILYGPPFYFSINFLAFIGYMIIMGVCGVLDHAGIRFALPGLYNTVDHDNHHAKYEVNYSFPFPYLDLLHGTFYGDFLGWKLSRKNTIYHELWRMFK
eukprot:gene6195-6831_t